MNKKALVLCSGGPDGVVAAALLKSHGFINTFLHFQYGQLAQVSEVEAVSELADVMGMGLMVIDISSTFSAIKSVILKTPAGEPARITKADALVPGRNLIFLSIAAGIAESTDHACLVLGNIAGGAYADNQPAFVDSFDTTFKLSVAQDGVSAVAPLNYLPKSEVIKLGMAHDVPFDLTWSCYRSGVTHCGACPSCLARKAGFAATSFIDPCPYLT